jgi:hypothetical protein
MAALGAYGGMEMFELMNKRNCMLVRHAASMHLAPCTCGAVACWCNACRPHLWHLAHAMGLYTRVCMLH